MENFDNQILEEDNRESLFIEKLMGISDFISCNICKATITNAKWNSDDNMLELTINTNDIHKDRCNWLGKKILIKLHNLTESINFNKQRNLFLDLSKGFTIEEKQNLMYEVLHRVDDYLQHFDIDKELETYRIDYDEFFDHRAGKDDYYFFNEYSSHSITDGYLCSLLPEIDYHYHDSGYCTAESLRINIDKDIYIKKVNQYKKEAKEKYNYHEHREWLICNYMTDMLDTYRKKYYQNLLDLFNIFLENYENENYILEGSIILINGCEVKVDIGKGVICSISKNEFHYNPDIKIGDIVEVYVESKGDGEFIFSHKMARALRAWDYINAAFEKDEIIQGCIKCRTKGGLLVDISGFEAFLPSSQIDIKPIRTYDFFIGKTMEFKIIKINKEYKNVVLSLIKYCNYLNV